MASGLMGRGRDRGREGIKRNQGEPSTLSLSLSLCVRLLGPLGEASAVELDHSRTRACQDR
jgi:hypothetical protein